MPIYKLVLSPTSAAVSGVGGDTEAADQSLYYERNHAKNGIESPYTNGTVEFRRQQTTDEGQSKDKVVRSISAEEAQVPNQKESIIQREVRELRQREAELAAMHDELQGNKASSAEVSPVKQEATRVEPTTPKESGKVKPVAVEMEKGRMTPPPPPTPSSIVIYNPATPTTTASNDLETSSGAKRVLSELKEQLQREEELRRQRRGLFVELETHFKNDVPLSSTESKPAAEGEVDSGSSARGKDETDAKKTGLFIVLPKHEDPATVASKGQSNKQDDKVTPKSPRDSDAGTKQDAKMASKSNKNSFDESSFKSSGSAVSHSPKSPSDRDVGTKQDAKMASKSNRNSFDESSFKSPGSAVSHSPKARPFENLEAIQSEFFFQYHPQVESPIDREIRLVREREEALRQARGIFYTVAGVTQDEEVEVTLARPSVNDDDPFEVKMKKYAEERMRTELEREKKREKDLQREGKVVVLSEQRTPDIIKHVTIVQPERQRSQEYSGMTSQNVTLERNGPEPRTVSASAAGHYSPSPSPSAGDPDHFRKLLLIEIEDNKKRENELREMRRSVGSVEGFSDSSAHSPDGRTEEKKNRDADQKRTINDHVDGSGSSRSSPSDRRSLNSLSEEQEEEEEQWNKRREPNRLAIIEQWEKGVIQSGATP